MFDRVGEEVLEPVSQRRIRENPPRVGQVGMNGTRKGVLDSLDLLAEQRHHVDGFADDIAADNIARVGGSLYRGQQVFGVLPDDLGVVGRRPVEFLQEDLDPADHDREIVPEVVPHDPVEHLGLLATLAPAGDLLDQHEVVAGPVDLDGGGRHFDRHRRPVGALVFDLLGAGLVGLEGVPVAVERRRRQRRHRLPDRRGLERLARVTDQLCVVVVHIFEPTVVGVHRQPDPSLGDCLLEDIQFGLSPPAFADVADGTDRTAEAILVGEQRYLDFDRCFGAVTRLQRSFVAAADRVGCDQQVEFAAATVSVGLLGRDHRDVGTLQLGRRVADRFGEGLAHQLDVAVAVGDIPFLLNRLEQRLVLFEFLAAIHPRERAGRVDR